MLLSRRNGRILRVAFTATLAILWLFALVLGQGFHHHEDEAEHEETCPICVAMLATMLLMPVIVCLVPELPRTMPLLAVPFLPSLEDWAPVRLRGPPVTV
jgi:hypothetical protein